MIWEKVGLGAFDGEKSKGSRSVWKPGNAGTTLARWFSDSNMFLQEFLDALLVLHNFLLVTRDRPWEQKVKVFLRAIGINKAATSFSCRRYIVRNIPFTTYVKLLSIIVIIWCKKLARWLNRSLEWEETRPYKWEGKFFIKSDKNEC